MIDFDLKEIEAALKAATPEAREEAKKVFTQAASIAGQWFGSGGAEFKGGPLSLDDAVALAGDLQVSTAEKLKAKEDATALARAVFVKATQIALVAATAAL